MISFFRSVNSKIRSNSHSIHFPSDVIFFSNLDLASKPTESLEQIAAFDVEKVLSKSATHSENLLLQVRQSLTKEWGTGSVGTLPKDFFQKLLTEVWSSGNYYHSSIVHIIAPCSNPSLVSF